MSSPESRDLAGDRVIAGFRDEITALDVRLVETVNARLKAVKALRAYKAERGLAFLDPDREAWLAAYVRRANRGPLSDEAVDELCRFVLELVKRETADA